VKLEVRIAISPTPQFFRQVEFLWRSYAMRCRGANVQFVVSVGDDCEPFDLTEMNPWSRGHVRWRWADREEFRRISYSAQSLDRLRYPTDADIVLLSDADTLLVRPIDDILIALTAQPAIAGVLAWVPPFIGAGPLIPGSSWQAVFASAGRKLPRDRYQHPGWGSMFAQPEHRFCPIYYNFGIVFVPGGVVQQLGLEYERQLPIALNAPIHPVYYAQVALTFAIYELDLPRLALEPRFNFPNLEACDRGYPVDLADVRIIHYLSEGVIGTRGGTWGSDDNFRRFLGRQDLTGSNEILRRSAGEIALSASR
jgi:hypothetical protein